MTTQQTTTGWATKDPAKLLSLVEDHYRADQTAKLNLARIWEENIRFIDGDQYIKYNATTRNYEPIPNRIDADYIPRACDNQLYVRYDILRSILTKQSPTFDYTANSTDPIDERKAKVTLAVNDTRAEVDCDYVINGEAAEWGISTGNAFLKTSWNPSSKIPAIDPTGKYIMGPDGNPQMIQLGDVDRRCVSPYKMAPDTNATSIETCSVLMEYGLQKTGDVKDWYNKPAGNGYTGNAGELQDEQIEDNTILKIVQDLKAYKNSKRPEVKGQVVLKEVYVKPCYDLPFGRMIIVANNKILYDNISIYAKFDLKKWHPYAHFRFRTIPGNFWGVTPITQCVKLQRSLNAIDTMCILHRQTMALGQWLIPINSIEDGALSGRVGLKINYKPGLGGAKPEKLPGTQMGADVLDERMKRIEAMDQICGTTEAIKGTPAGDNTSHVSLEIMREQTYSRHNPSFERWEKTLESSSQMRLLLIANLQTYDIPNFTKYLKRNLRVLNDIDIATFIGTQISDNTNIRIQAGSTVPRSTAAKLSSLIKFGEAGLLGDLVADPMRNQTFLQQFGIDSFKTATNVDYEKAKYNIALIESGRNNLVNLHPDDDHNIHIAYAMNKAKDPEWYSSRDPQVVEMTWNYIAEHKKLADQQQQQAKQAMRQERDETAYVQSLVNSGGPDGDPPGLDLFPTVLEQQVQQQEEQRKQQEHETLQRLHAARTMQGANLQSPMAQ